MRKIRVLVIDDSAYNRRTISRILAELPEVEVAGYASDGVEGLHQALALKPDLITLDLQMPTMEGFTFLRLLMSRCPTPVIVVSSQGEGDRVIQALELGAFDCVLKPGGVASHCLPDIGDDLRRKVRNLFAMNRAVGGGGYSPPDALPEPEFVGGDELVRTVDVVAIGASTGGPAALKKILSAFTEPPPCAVLVAQHMPECYTRAFAERLNRLTRFEVLEASDGDEVVPGRVLVAPGGRHLSLERRNETVVVKLLDAGPADRYLPSVDVLFQSCAEQFSARLLGVVLTGMGNDGAAGIGFIRERGGLVIAESEESAVVFGMPREAIATRMVDKVVRLDRMADEIALRVGIKREARYAVSGG
jgi:two-component system chemotaxis response regulator CheB